MSTRDEGDETREVNSNDRRHAGATQSKKEEVMKALRNSKGFTLIELLVVVAIIGILSAIAIPQFAAYRARGFDARAQSDLRNAATGEEARFASLQSYLPCGGAACNDTGIGGLPGFHLSQGVVLDMTSPDPLVAFGGTANHPSGTAGKTFTYDSASGGMQP